jgi:integrase
VASIRRHKRGGWYLSVPTLSGKYCQIYFPAAFSETQLAEIGRRVETLAAGNSAGLPPSPALARWLDSLAPEIRAKFDAVGLLVYCNHAAEPAPLGVLELWDDYLATRTEIKPSTRKGFTTARRHVAAAFAGRAASSVTVADAKQFARELAAAGHASTHAAKILSRLRQVYRYGVDAEKLARNPFAGVTITAKPDRTRDVFITAETAAAVLAQFTRPDARALFALARWCGLRVPNEILALTWDCVDWQLGRLRIPDETKTGWRVVPLFEPARTELAALFEAAPDGVPWIFARSRTSAATEYRRWLIAACHAANVKPWGKLWHNLRATRRTELQEQYPEHVCNIWIGHTARVARDHYLQITPDHWAAAAAQPAGPFQPTAAHQQPAPRTQ